MSDPDKWYRSTVPELQIGAASGSVGAGASVALAGGATPAPGAATNNVAGRISDRKSVV